MPRLPKMSLVKIINDFHLSQFKTLKLRIKMFVLFSWLYSFYIFNQIHSFTGICSHVVTDFVFVFEKVLILAHICVSFFLLRFPAFSPLLHRSLELSHIIWTYQVVEPAHSFFDLVLCDSCYLWLLIELMELVMILLELLLHRKNWFDLLLLHIIEMLSAVGKHGFHFEVLHELEVTIGVEDSFLLQVLIVDLLDCALHRLIQWPANWLWWFGVASEEIWACN